MSAPESDSARQELERAATMILSELTAKGQLPEGATYDALHALIAAVYGKGYLAGAEFMSRMMGHERERVSKALDRLA